MLRENSMYQTSLYFSEYAGFGFFCNIYTKSRTSFNKGSLKEKACLKRIKYTLSYCKWSNGLTLKTVKLQGCHLLSTLSCARAVLLRGIDYTCLNGSLLPTGRPTRVGVPRVPSMMRLLISKFGKSTHTLCYKCVYVWILVCYRKNRNTILRDLYY